MENSVYEASCSHVNLRVIPLQTIKLTAPTALSYRCKLIAIYGLNGAEMAHVAPSLAVKSRQHENREGFRINDKSSLDLFALSERAVGLPGEDYIFAGDGRSVQSQFGANPQRPGLFRRIRRARRRVLRRGFAPAFDEDSRPDREAPDGDSRIGKSGDGAGQLPGFQS